ncbi:MAG: hypothetical protein NVSMB18_19210 [Acetobacteraceae bacterium]
MGTHERDGDRAVEAGMQALLVEPGQEAQDRVLLRLPESVDRIRPLAALTQQAWPDRER